MNSKMTQVWASVLCTSESLSSREMHGPIDICQLVDVKRFKCDTGNRVYVWMSQTVLQHYSNNTGKEYLVKSTW